MRDAFVIKNKKVVDLIKSIFFALDQPWVDTQAYETSLLIEKYIKANVK